MCYRPAKAAGRSSAASPSNTDERPTADGVGQRPLVIDGQGYRLSAVGHH